MGEAQTQVDLSQFLMAKRSCPVCGSNNFEAWAKDDFLNAVKCQECTLVFVNPCLNEEGLTIVYQGHHANRLANTEECKKREKMYQIDRDFLLEAISEGSILDIGCGGGFFLDTFDSKKWKKSGLEIDPDTVAYAKEKFSIDVKIWNSKDIPLEDESMDVIVFRGSYEHMLYPDLVAKEVARVLKPNGYLYICAIPNADSFCAQFYREKWNQFDAKEHIFLFSQNTLRRMFEPLGLKFVKSALPYEDTPYCDLDGDMRKIMRDYQLGQDGKRSQMGVSPAFWGNMLNIVFKKA